jgi:asparagine synthase (glutamine-hydrolysing)
MCGWAGFLDLRRNQSTDALRALVARMAETLAHRGPDGAGEWTDARFGLAFGFRRLAVIDLSDAGAQPMRSASGRYTIVFNGEVYNAPDLRRALEQDGRAPAFRGHSDTEIALACIEAWGLDAALDRFIGMFAFALWDDQ